MERIEIHPESPQSRLIAKAAQIVIKRDGICLYPTDTVYGVGCCVSNNKRLKDIAKILHRDSDRLFSFICSDISQAGEYAEINNSSFKILKRYLPGPYTFILPSSNFVKKKISQKRKTVGIRIPDFPVTQELIRELGEPLANMSLDIPGEYRGDPDLFMTPDVLNGVDVMLDCGPVDMAGGSTIVDLTGAEPVLLREGKGEWHG
jgi:tRNA threonylcarbamoyl adenosine modification protein (Sua5/YciO/YrdC/YwlC family)